MVQAGGARAGVPQSEFFAALRRFSARVRDAERPPDPDAARVEAWRLTSGVDKLRLLAWDPPMVLECRDGVGMTAMTASWRDQALRRGLDEAVAELEALPELDDVTRQELDEIRAVLRALQRVDDWAAEQDGNQKVYLTRVDPRTGYVEIAVGDDLDTAECIDIHTVTDTPVTRVSDALDLVLGQHAAGRVTTPRRAVCGGVRRCCALSRFPARTSKPWLPPATTTCALVASTTRASSSVPSTR